jgi:hypothetical protein
MRVFLAFVFFCYCGVLMGADPKAAGAPKCDDDIDKKICDVLKCFGDHINDSTFTCKIMAVSPSKAADAFATQDSFPLAQKDWFPIGQGDVTKANWAVVKEAVYAAWRTGPPPRREWYSPATGLQITIPTKCGSVVEGRYLILMFFDTGSLEYYYYAKATDTAAADHGKCHIDDNRPWRDILTNAGISLPAKSAS